MKLSQEEIINLKRALDTCKIVNIDSAVISEDKIRGAAITKDVAIISPLKLDLGEMKLGVGRIAELKKRLELYGVDANIELASNERGDVTQVNISAGKSKIQFRCTGERQIRYPKSNEDQPFAVVSLTRDEVQQLSKAAKTLGAPSIVLHSTRGGEIRAECAEESTNDKFALELSTTAEFIENTSSFVFTYKAANLIAALDASNKDSDAQLTIGESGSITLPINGFTIMLMPQINGEE